MILIVATYAEDAEGFTRMSGDDPTVVALTAGKLAFYPHERG